MNERIKELAEQAEYNTRKEHNNAYWSLQNEIAEDETFLKKFAELIVRECADLFEVEYGQSAVSGNEVAKVLKKHFGVEL